MNDDHDAAWGNFLASLDPVALQREHAGPGDLDAERPGSRQDHEMRFAHDYVRSQLAALAAESEEERRARIADAQNADADREIRTRGFDRVEDIDEHDIEAAIRSYSQRHNERHAA